VRRAVVGIGSPFGVDRVGWQVVERLTLPSEVERLTLDRPGLALIDAIKGFDQVVLVDAVLGADQPVMVLDRNQLLEDASPSLSSHAAGVAAAIALGSALGELPERLDLVGISVEGMEETVDEARIDRAAARVLELLQ